jgi:hypothetical protein
LLLASQMAERPEGSASVAHINTSQLISQKWDCDKQKPSPKVIQFLPPTQLC